MKFPRLRWLMMLIACVAAAAEAQLGEPHATWKAIQVEGGNEPGATPKILIEAEVAPGYHLYPNDVEPDGPSPTTFTADGKGVKAIGEPISHSPTKKAFDAGFQKEISFFKDKAQFLIPVTVGSGLEEGTITVNFQTCKDGSCDPPTDVPISLKGLPVVAADSTTFATPEKPAPTGRTPAGDANVPGEANLSGEAAQIAQARERGLLAYLGLAVGAGFLALLTPCVFPMIPITVSFFSKQSEGSKPIAGAGMYALGIIVTFTLMGILSAILIGSSGLTDIANDKWVNLGLAIVFIVLAFSLFGVFEIGVPSRFINKIDAAKVPKWIAPALMGLTFSLTSFTCTLPFVGSLLVSASQGDVLYPIFGMLAFSTTFALPFFLLALFPEFLSKLPKSGAWMVVVKAYMGFIELIAAVKFLSTFDLGLQLGLITRQVNLALWFGLLVMAGLFLLGWIRLPKVNDGKIGWIRRGFGIATLGASAWILSGFKSTLGDLDGYLPPDPYPGSSQAALGKGEGNFLTSYEQARAKAKQENKPLFIDFTGVYCTNCRVMERTVFPAPEVQREFEKMVLVKLFTDRKEVPQDKVNQKLLSTMANTITLPTYVVVEPDGSLRSRPFTRDSKEFAEWLRGK